MATHGFPAEDGPLCSFTLWSIALKFQDPDPSLVTVGVFIAYQELTRQCSSPFMSRLAGLFNGNRGVGYGS